MPAIQTVIDFILHIDVHLVELVATYGQLIYVILFGIVFAETGFVITPFLPGDSLLFAAGAISALGSMNLWAVMGVLFTAAVLGDTVNYWIGHFFGQKIIDSPKFPLVKKEHLDKAQEFYAKHGGKAIILSRFVPIVRTFAPFVAGVGRMSYKQFTLYNLVGAVLWVPMFTLTGFFFGNIPSIKHNFSLVILVIIAISLLPIIWEAWSARKNQDHQA